MDIKATLHRLDELRDSKEKLAGLLRALDYESKRVSRGLSAQRTKALERFSRGENAILNKTEVEKSLEELKAEEDELLACVAPLIERLPVGHKRLVTELRFIEGMSCMVIGWKLHCSRSYVYKALGGNIEIMAQEAERLEREA